MTENKINSLPKRDEIDNKYKWKLEDIYSSDELWEEDFKKAEAMSVEMSACSGRLGESDEILHECLKKSDALTSLFEKLFVYARMRRDEDNAKDKYQGLTDRAMALSSIVYASVSFIVPEILTIDENILNGYIEKNEGLLIYKRFFEEVLRKKSHTLSKQEERILALSSEMANAADDIFTMLNNADIKFPVIKDEDGNETELTKGRYIKFLESKDRRVRQDAFNALYETYRKLTNTFTATLSSSIKRDRFFSGVRNYESSLAASLDEDNISENVYDNLIVTVSENLHLLKQYLEIRKKLLKIEEMHMYDLYVPLVEDPQKNIPYNNAVKMVKDGLQVFGEDYRTYLNTAFKEGWVDVYENQGKTSGAYSWGSYNTHPYVLLNYQGTINDVFTIAHEMGHAMHSYYTNMTQPYTYSQYKIFVAEVASTVNESLLLKHLLENSKDKKETAYLLNHFLEEFRGTVFRQTMFAEFEKIIHSKNSSGEPVTSETLCSIYKELNRKYFGDGIIIDRDIEMEWARIPHFYSSFYVYKYATGFSAAIALSEKIINEGSRAVDNYKEFLKSGSSDYPLELLKKAGVDMCKPEPVQNAMKAFEQALKRFEELI